MMLLKKEWKLVMMPVPLLFLLLSALVLVPNYPYYVTFFYTTLGIFLMMQFARENRDLYYIALLPVTKREMVRARFLLVLSVEALQVLVCVHEYNPTTLDRVLGWLMNPFAQGIFIMLIVGGIYFELQTPGVGFPLVAAVLGAVLYFSPLYLEGMVQNWEPILFVVGLLLIAVEIFVLPGFGIAGIAGIVAVVTGLAFAAIDNDVLRHVFSGELSAGRIVRPFLVVIVGSVAAFVAALYFGRRFLTGDSRLRSRIVLTTDLTPEQGYVGHRLPQDGLVGRTGTVTAVLRPSGKIVLDGIYYDAVAENGLFIGRGEKVRVVRVGNGQLYCKQDFSDPSES